MLFWLVVLLISVPAISALSSVFTNSGNNTLPNSDTSVIAQDKLAAEFPNASGPPASSLLLLVGDNITGPAGQNATLAVTSTLESDPQIQFLGDIESIYSAYAGFLSLESSVGLEALRSALASGVPLPSEINSTAQTVWAAPATYVHNWTQIARSLSSGVNVSAANWPAYVQAHDYYNSSPVEQRLLATFYNGSSESDPGFNSTVSLDCLSSLDVIPCADSAARATIPSDLPSIFSNATLRSLAVLGIEDLDIQDLGNWSAIEAVGAAYLGNATGLPPSWESLLWNAFPNGTASSATVQAWCKGLTQRLSVTDFPLPIPSSIRSSFISRSGNATLLIVAFTKPDNYTAGGQTPIYQDVDRINSDLSSTLASSAEYRGITFYQTGTAPLDSASSYLATSTLGILLLLTIVLLIVIMVGYFRAPAAPLVTFAGIGVSVIVTLAGLFVVGKFVTTISSELESIVIIFLMAVVTDYSIFMMARYREELVEGRSSEEAIVASVRWAGQSITTSGLTVFATTIAMTFSGLNFLHELGISLAISVVVAILMALTIIPSVLIIVGPRVFWPYTKSRFTRDAVHRRERIRARKTYFSRAGGFATRRSVPIIVLIILLSAPVIYVALNVPVSYDLTNTGLPSSNPAQQGLTELEGQFGQSTISSSFVLVTFSQPLLENGSMNPAEITDVASLTSLMNSTLGVAQVTSLAGPGGSALSQWRNFSELPLGPRTALLAAASSYLGTDDRTVQFQVVTSSSGYSSTGSAAFDSVERKVSSFRTSHAEVAAVYFGGAAPATADYQSLTNNALEGMLIGVSVAIFIILLILLGAALVPPLALAAIGLSILWSWAAIYAVVGFLEGVSLSFFIPVILVILVLGLGMDYNALLLTRIKEERLKGVSADAAIQGAVTHAGGVVTAAAVILGGPFLLLGLTSSLGIISAIGLGIGIATLLQAFVAQTYLTPAILSIGGHKIWWGLRSKMPRDDSAFRDWVRPRQ